MAYRTIASIIQGDPFSMFAVALMLRPWIMQMREMGVVPRVLADDLQIMAEGDQHNNKFMEAYGKTQLHMQDMGARSQPIKGFTFSSCRRTRAWLETHKWRTMNTTVTVIKECRDLGAHLCTRVKNRNGTTLTTRIGNATKYIEQIDKHKAPYGKQKQVNKS